MEVQFNDSGTHIWDPYPEYRASTTLVATSSADTVGSLNVRCSINLVIMGVLTQVGCTTLLTVNHGYITRGEKVSYLVRTLEDL